MALFTKNTANWSLALALTGLTALGCSGGSPGRPPVTTPPPAGSGGTTTPPGGTGGTVSTPTPTGGTAPTPTGGAGGGTPTPTGGATGGETPVPPPDAGPVATPTPTTGGALNCTPMGEVPALKKSPASDAPIAGAGEVASPPDTTDEIWVISHFSGDLRVVKGGKLQPMPIVHVDVRQNPPGKEQGLLSIAFDPKYTENKTFYLFYSAAAPTGQTTIQAFKRTGDLTAMAGDKIWDKPHPHMFHNGGQIKFGPDGKLYLSIGNNAAPAESQKAEGLYGRILQIDVASKMGKTWDMGLRNPYRFTFDPQTFDIYIGDVGDGGAASEKFFFEAMGQGGKNWGYRGNDNRTGVEYIDQIASGGGAGIGGVVYRGKKMPGLCGRYFYGHYSNGTVFSVKMEGGKPTDRRSHPELTTAGLSSFGIDAAGEIYMGSLSGPVNRIDPAM